VMNILNMCKNTFFRAERTGGALAVSGYTADSAEVPPHPFPGDSPLESLRQTQKHTEVQSFD